MTTNPTFPRLSLTKKRKKQKTLEMWVCKQNLVSGSFTQLLQHRTSPFLAASKETEVLVFNSQGALLNTLTFGNKLHQLSCWNPVSKILASSWGQGKWFMHIIMPINLPN